MKHIYKLMNPLSRLGITNSLVAFAVLALLCLLPVNLAADQLWNQPLNVAQAENLIFPGQVVFAEDGSYAAFWTANDKTGLRKCYFQQFSANNQPLGAQILISNSNIYTEIYQVHRCQNGNYLILTRNFNTICVYMMNSVLKNAQYVLSFTAIGSVCFAVVTDDVGGAWVAYQGYSMRNLYVNYIGGDGHLITYSHLIVESVNTNANQINIIPQADGTALIGYVLNSQLRLLKVSASLQLLGDKTFSVDSESVNETKLFQTGDGNLIWVYHQTGDAGADTFRALKTSLVSVLWPQPLDLYRDEVGDQPQNWDSQRLTDGSFLLSCLYRNNNYPRKVYIQRFDENAQILYSDPAQQERVVQGTQASDQIRIYPHTDANAWLLIEKSSFSSGQINACSLYLDSSGFTWQEELLIYQTGFRLTHGNVSTAAVVKLNAMQVFFQLAEAGSSSINHVTVTPEADLIEPGLLVSKRAGSILSSCITSIGGNLLLAWVEHTKPYFPSYSEYNHSWIRYQICNPQGQKLLATDGTTISGGELKGLVQLNALKLPDNQVLLWWLETFSVLRAQLIDAQGNQLWEEGGRIIVDAAYAPDCSIKASYHQGNVYFAWGRSGSSGIRAQKLTNGVPQWGAQGRVLINSADLLFSHAFVGVQWMWQDYLLYYSGISSKAPYPSAPCLVLYRFDEEGLPQAGYGTGGNFAIFSQANNYSIFGKTGCFVTPEGILIGTIRSTYYVDPLHPDEFWCEDTGSAIQLMGYDGLAQWDYDEIWSTAKREIVATDADSFYYNNTYTNTLIKMSYQREQISALQYTNRWLLRGFEIQNGLFIGIAANNRYFTMTSELEIGWPHDTLLWNEYQPLNYLSPVIIDDSMYLVWNTPYRPYPELNHGWPVLQLQRFNTSLTVGDDPTSPALVKPFALSSAPNPFHHSTKLAISCKEPLRASLAIYNLRGQKVRTLYDGNLPSGKTELSWDGKDDRGKTVSAGVYFCRVKGPRGREMVKILKL